MSEDKGETPPPPPAPVVVNKKNFLRTGIAAIVGLMGAHGTVSPPDSAAAQRITEPAAVVAQDNRGPAPLEFAPTPTAAERFPTPSVPPLRIEPTMTGEERLRANPTPNAQPLTIEPTPTGAQRIPPTPSTPPLNIEPTPTGAQRLATPTAAPIPDGRATPTAAPLLDGRAPTPTAAALPVTRVNEAGQVLPTPASLPTVDRNPK